MTYAGSDLIYAVTIEDSKGSAINFSSATEVIFKFTNCNNVSIIKTKTDTDIVEGDTSNEYQVELQDTETAKLKRGSIEVEITLTVSNADFSDGEATTVLYSKLTLS